MTDTKVDRLEKKRGRLDRTMKELSRAIRQKQITIEEVAQLCEVGTDRVVEWITTDTRPALMRCLRIDGLLRQRNVIQKLVIAPGDICAAAEFVLSEGIHTPESLGELIDCDPAQILSYWIILRSSIGGLRKMEIETIFWEQGWLEPSYLAGPFGALAYLTAKRLIDLETLAQALGIQSRTIRRWLCGEYLPNEMMQTIVKEKVEQNYAALLEPYRALCQRSIAATPATETTATLESIKGFDEVAFELALRTCRREAEILLGASADARRAFRRKAATLVFETSNLLNALCSEEARKQLVEHARERK